MNNEKRIIKRRTKDGKLNPEYDKQRHAKNKEKICAYKRQHRRDNIEKYLERERNRNYTTRYRITREEALKLKRKGCEICGAKKDKIYIDHKSGTKKVRGVLCMKCNCALGLMNESVELLEKMIQYLKDNKSVNKNISEHFSSE